MSEPRDEGDVIDHRLRDLGGEGTEWEAIAGDLIRQMADPVELSPTAIARIRMEIDRKAASRSPRFRLAIAASVLVGAAGLAAAISRLVAERPPVYREVAAARCGAVRLQGARGLKMALVGPGAARVREDGGPLVLTDGRLDLDAGDARVMIEAAGARVTVASGGTAEISVLEHKLRVAAWEGGCTVEWRGAVVEVEAGTAWTPEGVRPIKPRRRADLAPLLDGELGGSCAGEEVAPGRSAVAPAPAPPSADPMEAPPATPATAVVASDRPRGMARAAEPGAVVPPPDPAPAPAAIPGDERDDPKTRDPDPAGEPAESALGEETRLFGDAIRKLRKEKDPAGALAALDQYRARFPDGTHGPDVTLARVDALLALGRRGEAMGLLTGLGDSGLERLPRAAELRVLRGELLAEAGRSTEALADFDLTLARSPVSALEERALWGRASCQGKLGRDGAVRADLERYLARFPDGRFAAAARRALGK